MLPVTGLLGSFSATSRVSGYRSPFTCTRVCGCYASPPPTGSSANSVIVITDWTRVILAHLRSKSLEQLGGSQGNHVMTQHVHDYGKLLVLQRADRSSMRDTPASHPKHHIRSKVSQFSTCGTHYHGCGHSRFGVLAHHIRLLLDNSLGLGIDYTHSS